MYKIMIVDDEILARVGIRSLIQWEKYGFTVVAEAENGKKALEIARQCKPDIIITDIKMPVMDGIELIKKIKEEEHDIKFIVLSSYNDFEYVKEAMKHGAEEYILKLSMEPEELLKILKHLAEKLTQERSKQKNMKKVEMYHNISTSLLKEKLLKDLIHGNVRNALSQAQLLNIDFPTNNLVCMVLHVENEDIYKKYSKGDIYILNDSIINILKKTLSKYIHAYACQMKEAEFVLILSLSNSVYNKEVHDELHCLINHLKTIIKKYFNLSTFIGISTIHQGYENIKSAYQEASQAIKYCSIYERKDVVWYQDIKEKESNQDVMSMIDKLIELEEALGKDSISQINTIFEDIKKDLKERRTIQQGDLKGICSALIFIINSFAARFCMDVDQIWGIEGNPFPLIEEFRNIDHVLEWIIWIQNRIIQYLEEVVECSAVIVQAKQYIQAHYHQPISLRDVAQKLKLSPNYFSELFKKETGKNFIDYVISLRVERAKELLKRPEYKIYQIAHQVGYENEYYFSRIFKKTTGISPIQYRNSNYKH